jgi:hypothetical protein
MVNLTRKGTLSALALVASVGAVSAQSFSDLARQIPGVTTGDQACPDVVVVDIPFCTDECGQFLRSERAAAVAEAFEKADINNDGTTYAYVTAYASRLAPTGYNQALSERRLALATRLARGEGAQVVFQAPYGETRASGTESADLAEDRFARIYFTEATNNMVQNTEGGIRPRDGINVIGFSAPACNGHLRTGPGN